MRVLVTGGAGFIGSHLVKELITRGDEVVILDSFDDSYDPAIKEDNIAGLDLELIRGDIRDAEVVDRAVRGAEVVIHLAAKAGVRESLRTPLLYEAVNVQGTMHLLEALRRAPDARLVFASSSSVYGARKSGPFAETDAADSPVSPYAATKRSGELLCHAAHAGWGLRVSCLRFFTVYGPRQRPSMAISRFIHGVMRGEALPIYGDGSSTRDYTWAGDAVRGILAAVANPEPFGIYNIGSGSPIRLDGLVSAISQIVGREAKIDRLDPQPGDVPMTYAQIDQARNVLGWTPQMQLRRGLEFTVEWVRQRVTSGR
jgi:UDP-glucuronate 4-epimerase